MATATTTINTCALYGSSTYANNWLGINVFVILITLLVIAAVYMLSGFIPTEQRAKMNGVVRFEIIQAMISIAIIVILLGFSLTACSIVSTMSQSLAKTSLNPFQYADYYVGSVSLNSGLALLSNLYATAVSYSVLSSVTQAFGGSISALPIKLPLGLGFYINNVSSILGNLGNLYLVVFSPLIVIAVGLLFVQYLAIPLMQYTAFTVVLPAAIAMRSIAFTSNNLGDASNALLALAIAMYIIYPMTIAFDGYAVAWIFTPCAVGATSFAKCNPTYSSLGSAFTLNTITPSSFFSAAPLPSAAAGGSLASGWQLVTSFLIQGPKGSSTLGNIFGPLVNAMSQMRRYVNQMAQFLFVSVVLFVINLSITIGLSMSLYKALKSSLGESANFWK